MSKEKLSLTKQSQILILGQALSFAFNFLVPVVVVRFFNVSEYGVYKQLFLVIMTVTVILPFGIAESLYYFIPRNKDNQQHYIFQTVGFLFLAGALFLGIMLFRGKSILSSLNLGELNEYVVTLSLYIVFMCISLPLERILVSRERVKLSSSVTVISEVLKGICIVSATVLTRDLKVVMNLLVGFSVLRMAAFFYYLASSNLMFFSIGKLDTKRLKEQLRYSLPFGFAVVVATIRRFFHQYLISFYFAARDFAIYSVGVFQLPLMNVIYTTVSNVALIRISECHQKKEYGKIIEIWLNSSRKLALIYFPVTLLFILSSKEFITIFFTDQYLDSIPFFIVTLLQLPVDVFITHSILKAYNENRYILHLNIIALIMTSILVFALTKKFGMLGATAGTSFSYAFVRILEIVKIKKLIDVTFSRLVPWKIFIRILLACLMCGTATLIVRNLELFGSVQLLFVTELLLFSIMYLLIIYFNGILTTGEKEDIKKIIYKLNPVFFLK